MGIEQHQVKAAELLHAAGILPVVTVHTLDQARAVSAALLEGGLPAIELTLRTPVAMDALAMLKRELPDVVVGAGTVLTVEQMQQSIDAGADFLVTPGTPPALADALAAAPLPVVPGAATPTELLSLYARGFRVCKLFPATAVGGLAMIKGLAGPVADLAVPDRRHHREHRRRVPRAEERRLHRRFVDGAGQLDRRRPVGQGARQRCRRGEDHQRVRGH